MKMEKEEQKLLEQGEVEVEEQGEEETTLLLRKSRTENDSKTTEIAVIGLEVSDGVSASNGHTVLSELVENGAENEEKTPSEEQKIEKLDGVLENEPEAIDGEQKHQNLVFYDNIEGLWKCRLCSWTYRNGRVCVDQIQNHKGQLHKLMYLKTLNFESKGVESTFTYYGEKQILKDSGSKELDISSLDFAVQSYSTSTLNNRYDGEIENNGVSSSILKLSQVSSQEGITSYESSKEIESAVVDLINEGEIEDNDISSSIFKPPQVSTKEIESAAVDLINDDDLEVTELDVERVIQEQTTHDLYCPNCNSCITKRVILRKRKRRIRISEEEVKRNKTETALSSKLGTVSVQSHGDRVDNDTHIIPADEEERDRGPDLFRCLSCFSFFIPTGNGFFCIFGERSGKVNVQDELAPSRKKNWFTSMFTPNKQQTVVGQESSFQTDLQRGDAVVQSSNLSDLSGQPSFSQKPHSLANVSEGLVVTTGKNDTWEGKDEILPLPNQKPSVNGKAAKGVKDKLDVNATRTVDTTMGLFDSYSQNQLSESKFSQEVHGNRESGLSVTILPTRTQVASWKSVKDAISFSQGFGKLSSSGNKGSSALEESDKVQIPNQTVQPRAADTTMGLFDSYAQDQLSESKFSQEVHGNRESDPSVTILPTRTQVTNWKSVKDAISFSQGVGKLLNYENKGSSTLEESDYVQIPNQTVQPRATDEEVIQFSPTSISVLKASDVDGELNISVFIPREEHDVRASIITESVLENKNTNFVSSDSGHVHLSKGTQHINTKTNIEFSNESLKVDNISVLKDAAVSPGTDTMITIDSQPTESSQTVQDIIHPSETPSVSQLVNQISVADRERAEERKEFKIEVVKSIVYGGLAESITSLSVVSSAAGGGAATLNVLALGAANLIGGFFIICHNLWDLRYDRFEQVSNQITEQRDRYRELLGRRQNFILHAVVAIISYIIFGVVPPIVYGFSYRKSDDKQLKLVVLGAASLLCILVLAIGKAYTQRPPKTYLKTVTSYVILGFMVSGVSYAAGGLVERLLDELGLFQTSSTVPEMNPTGSGWSSY